jgi:hypothetical protein
MTLGGSLSAASVGRDVLPLREADKTTPQQNPMDISTACAASSAAHIRHRVARRHRHAVATAAGARAGCRARLRHLALARRRSGTP